MKNSSIEFNFIVHSKTILFLENERIIQKKINFLSEFVPAGIIQLNVEVQLNRSIGHNEYDLIAFDEFGNEYELLENLEFKAFLLALKGIGAAWELVKLAPKSTKF